MITLIKIHLIDHYSMRNHLKSATFCPIFYAFIPMPDLSYCLPIKS